MSAADRLRVQQDASPGAELELLISTLTRKCLREDVTHQGKKEGCRRAGHNRWRELFHTCPPMDMPLVRLQACSARMDTPFFGTFVVCSYFVVCKQ